MFLLMIVYFALIIIQFTQMNDIVILQDLLPTRTTVGRKQQKYKLYTRRKLTQRVELMVHCEPPLDSLAVASRWGLPTTNLVYYSLLPSTLTLVHFSPSPWAFEEFDPPKPGTSRTACGTSCTASGTSCTASGTSCTASSTSCTASSTGAAKRFASSKNVQFWDPMINDA